MVEKLPKINLSPIPSGYDSSKWLQKAGKVYPFANARDIPNTTYGLQLRFYTAAIQTVKGLIQI